MCREMIEMNMSEDERKRVHIELTEDEYESLRQIAIERGVTVEEVASEAVDRLLVRQHRAIDDALSILDDRRDGVTLTDGGYRR